MDTADKPVRSEHLSTAVDDLNGGTAADDVVISKKGVFFSLLMIMINIPALIGA